MRRAVAALALALLAGPSLAHGGRYVGPVANRSPGSREANDWPQPDHYDYGTPAPPDSWRFAWHLMENGFAESRPRSAGTMAARVIEEEILPALRRTASDEHLNFEIQGAAILGLARCGDPGARPLLRSVVSARGEKASHGVAEASAALGLGIAAGAAAEDAVLLRSMVFDRKARQRTRALACLALALLERGKPAPETLSALDLALIPNPDDAPSWQDLPAVAAHCLGLLESSGASAVLARFLGSPEVPVAPGSEPDPYARASVVRCQAAAALGRAAAREPRAAAAALAILDRVLATGGKLPAQGAVIGLGHLGSAGDEETAMGCVRRLAPLAAAAGTETHARRFAALALARIASRAPSPARDAAFEAVKGSLAAGLPSPSWAALVAGVAGRGCSPAERSALSAGVRKLWDAGVPAGLRLDVPAKRARVEDRGGCLVALGLLGDVASRPILDRVLTDQDELEDLRGYAATGLGFLGDTAVVPVLRKLLHRRQWRTLHRGVAAALGMLGDGESDSALVERILDPKTGGSTLVACAQALGRIGDTAAARDLKAILDDPGHPDLTRATAVQALGRMAAGSRLDPIADLSMDAPYRACSESLVDIWSLF